MPKHRCENSLKPKHRGSDLQVGKGKLDPLHVSVTANVCFRINHVADSMS